MPPSGLTFGRLVIVVAVLLQAIGKVLYGTWLPDVPSPVFVFVSFALTAAFFLGLSRRGMGDPARGPVLLLNASTALTFLSFFFSLKMIEPAIVGAVEIGVGPLLAVAVAFVTTGEKPTVARGAVCGGVLAGCAILAVAAVRGSGFDSSGIEAWLGLGASVAAGSGAVLITIASKSLTNRNWTLGAILAHRFYLILPISLVLSANADLSGLDWSMSLVGALAAVSLIGVLLPLYLLQVGIARCDPYTVMVTMAALPVMTFVIEGLSPAYAWSWSTLAGVLIVTTFLVGDVLVAPIARRTARRLAVSLSESE